MSGVLNEVTASSIKYSIEEHCVYIKGPMISDSTFKFDIVCKHPVITFFFDTKTLRCLVAQQHAFGSDYQCFLLRFWLEQELPVLSVRIFENQHRVMETIYGQFRDQYASLLLDGIINS